MINFQEKNLMFLLNFNKIFINSRNTSISFYFLTNNFFLLNSFKNYNSILLNSYHFNYLGDSLNNFKKIKLLSKKNIYLFLKKNNKYRNFLFFFKYLSFFKFRFNKLFYHFFITKNENKNKINALLYSTLNFKNFTFNNYFNIYFKNFKKSWAFLIGKTISPFFWDLFSKKNWIRKNIRYKISNNRYYFSLYSNKKSFKNKIKIKILNKQKFHKKHILNNYFYFKILNRRNSFLKYSLKINPFFHLPKNKKKNYDWFLSKPYLFLNTYKNFKLNKQYSNNFVIFLYKKYFRFFNILKRVNFSFRHKKTNNFFFLKTFYNPDVRSRSYNNRYFQTYLNLKNKFSFFNNYKFSFFNSFSLNKNKTLKKRFLYFWFTKVLRRTRVLKKNKLIFMYKLFLNKKIIFEKVSRKLKKRVIFIKSFRLTRNLIKKQFYSFKNTRLKIKHKYKYKYSKPLFNLKKKRFLKFTIKYKYNKVFFKFFFLSNKKKFIKISNNRNIHFKWFNFFLFKFNKIKKKLIFNKVNYKSSSNRYNTHKNSQIWTKFKKPFFYTKNRINFLFKFNGFLFLNNTFYNNLNNSFFSHTIKKTLYSFSYKNEIHKFILKRYIKNNYLFDSLNKNNIFQNFNNRNFDLIKDKNFLLYYNNKLINYFQNEDFFFNSFNKKTYLEFFNSKNISNFTSWNYFNNQLQYFKNTHGENFDFTVKRVRFKPGYMTLWREVRNVLKSSLNLNFRYQYKLTKYLIKYNKFVNFKTFLSFEMRLLNILLKSRLINDFNLCSIFIKNNLIYLNGFLCNNPFIQIFIGDFIQIIVNLKFYIMSRWFLNLNLKKKNKLRNIFRKKNIFTQVSDEKKRSYNIPKKVLFNKNLFDDCPNFLEVDYFTLSAFVIYEPFLWSDLNPYNLIEQKFSIINLYNWKYIT